MYHNYRCKFLGNYFSISHKLSKTKGLHIDNQQFTIYLKKRHTVALTACLN